MSVYSSVSYYCYYYQIIGIYIVGNKNSYIVVVLCNFK